jgi:hypothetical protein
MDTVLQYMNDDSLFGRTKTGTKGLEETGGPSKGYGLDGVAPEKETTETKGISINTYENPEPKRVDVTPKTPSNTSAKPADPDKEVVK